MPVMRGPAPNIAILLALTALLVTGVASTADAKVGGNAAAAAQKMSKGAQVRLNRMKAKMALRPKGTMAQKTRRQIRLGKRKMVKLMSRRQLRPGKVQLMRAASRREVGLDGSESERTRARFARDGIGERFDGPELQAPVKKKDTSNEEELEKLGLKQRKKMRVAAKRRAAKDFKKLRNRSRRGD
jgi:hypothetical protein